MQGSQLVQTRKLIKDKLNSNHRIDSTEEIQIKISLRSVQDKMHIKSH